MLGSLRNILKLWDLYWKWQPEGTIFKIKVEWQLPSTKLLFSFVGASGHSPSLLLSLPGPLTWNHSTAGGLEADSSAACKPPPRLQMRPGRWWPARLWQQSPRSPCFQLAPSVLVRPPHGLKLERHKGWAAWWSSSKRAGSYLLEGGAEGSTCGHPRAWTESRRISGHAPNVIFSFTTGLAKKFIPVFAEDIMGKLERTSWPTESKPLLPSWSRMASSTQDKRKYCQ